MKGSEFFAKAGGTLWIILAGGAAILMLLYWLGVFDAERFNWRVFATLFGVGGLASFVIAGILAVWEKSN